MALPRYFTNNFDDYRPGTLIQKDEEVSLRRIFNFLNIIDAGLKHPGETRDIVNGGLYIGVTGISYMYYKLSKNSSLPENKALFVQKAMDLLKPALAKPAGDETSFLLGDAGSYAVGAVVSKCADKPYAELIAKYMALYNTYLNPNFFKCGGDELFVGRAGYLAGYLWLKREFKDEKFPDMDLFKLCDVIVKSGKAYAKGHDSPCPLMYHYYNTEYLGAAHGVSFIMQMLITVPGYIEFNKAAAEDIKKTIEYIASLQDEEGNWPSSLDEVVNENELVHWCHGAPGIVYLMARAFLVYKDERYMKACVKAGEVVWKKGLLRKGVGICHGVSGSGYVFLILYRLTNDVKYLYQATCFANFLFDSEFNAKSATPDHAYSLYEGVAGTVCFLADLMEPSKAEFPFEDVFSM